MDVHAMPVPPRLSADDLHDAAHTLVVTGTRQGLTVATTESLTAGLVAATIAEVPGASAVLRGGFIVYATELKHVLAGVPTQMLETLGAVAPDTAAEMARGAAQRCGADIGIGLTGVAGPDLQEGKPVGTVFIGVWAAGRAHTFEIHAAGDRAAIRRTAAWGGLSAATDMMFDLPSGEQNSDVSR